MDLLSWLASVPPAQRDAAIEERLGIRAPQTSAAPPGRDLIGYHASGVAAVVRMLIEVPVAPSDVFVDLGSGLGKVVLLTRLLTGATSRGVELQPALVGAARQVAARLGIEADFVAADARDADLETGTAFYMYLPFEGAALATVLRRLHAVARRRAIVVCALGVDLERHATWLRKRPLDDFWLAIYDSHVTGVAARPATARAPLLGPLADAIAHGR